MLNINHEYSNGDYGGGLYEVTQYNATAITQKLIGIIGHSPDRKTLSCFDGHKVVSAQVNLYAARIADEIE